MLTSTEELSDCSPPVYFIADPSADFDPVPDRPSAAKPPPRRRKPGSRAQRVLQRTLRWRTPGATRPGAAIEPLSSARARRLRALIRQGQFQRCRHELAHAELAGRVTEFQALSLHARLAIAEKAGPACDYLEMAEAVASTTTERATIAELRASHQLLAGEPERAVEYCLAALDRGDETIELWIPLLIALARLGDLDSVDAALHSLTQLDGAGAVGLARALAAEPELRGVLDRVAALPLRRNADAR